MCIFTSIMIILFFSAIASVVGLFYFNVWLAHFTLSYNIYFCTINYIYRWKTMEFLTQFLKRWGTTWSTSSDFPRTRRRNLVRCCREKKSWSIIWNIIIIKRWTGLTVLTWWPSHHAIVTWQHGLQLLLISGKDIILSCNSNYCVPDTNALSTVSSTHACNLTGNPLNRTPLRWWGSLTRSCRWSPKT